MVVPIYLGQERAALRQHMLPRAGGELRLGNTRQGWTYLAVVPLHTPYIPTRLFFLRYAAYGYKSRKSHFHFLGAKIAAKRNEMSSNAMRCK